jgi:hypothetical protein
MFSELDVVKLKFDLPEENLTSGQLGTIHSRHSGNPSSYLVEFCDSEGTTLALVEVPEDQLTLFWRFVGGQ